MVDYNDAHLSHPSTQQATLVLTWLTRVKGATSGQEPLGKGFSVDDHAKWFWGPSGWSAVWWAKRGGISIRRNSVCQAGRVALNFSSIWLLFRWTEAERETGSRAKCLALEVGPRLDSVEHCRRMLRRGIGQILALNQNIWCAFAVLFLLFLEVEVV